MDNVITRPRVSDDEKHDVLYFHMHGAMPERIAENMGIKVNRVKYIINTYKDEKPWYIKLLHFFGIKI